jgi:23S rRNA pseudouridine1911/1915/1917 synthase
MPRRTETITIEQSLPQERLDAFLRAKFPAVSRGTIQRLLAEGHIRVDGQIVKPTHHPRIGEIVSVHWPEPRTAQAQPEAIPLDILYEDADLLVLNKPAGLVVHPAAGHEEHTLVNALLHHCAGQLSGIGGVARPGIVHRLDKETSGCLIVAKTDFAHLKLSAQFSSREVEKIYQAIVCGEIRNEGGEIRGAIARHPAHRKRMTVTDGKGREAHTSYRVLERLRETTLIEALLHTGRTHQIRVHLQHLGFPVVGDAIYGRRQNAHLKESTGFAAARQLLHARKLAVLHPRTGKPMSFEAPPPEDFAIAVDFFRIKSRTL